MSYDPDVALARKISRALRITGLAVSRSRNDSLISVSSKGDGGKVVIEAMKEDPSRGFDVSMWQSPGSDTAPSRALLRALACLLREAGLRVDVAR